MSLSTYVGTHGRPKQMLWKTISVYTSKNTRLWAHARERVIVSERLKGQREEETYLLDSFSSEGKFQDRPSR